MKLIVAFALLIVAVLATPKDELIAGTRTFAGTLYKELIRNKQNQNVIFSPITVQTLMSLLASASHSEDIEIVRQIRTALSLPYGKANRESAFQSVLAELNTADDDFKVFDATKMYFKHGYSVRPWYQTIATNSYRAEIETINFGNSVNSARSINRWVAKQTHDKITNFVDYYEISANTENLLINTLYLTGKWDIPFVVENNTIRNFHSPNGAKAVTMMNDVKTYEYYEDNDAQYLKLGMVRDGGGAEMVFVLPKQQHGLKQLENNIQNLLKPVTFTYQKVAVTLPKFSFSNNMKLKPVLQKIGVTALFNWQAQLEGLRFPGHPYIIITDVLQKAFIEVTEWGVTAASASGASANVDSANADTKIFTADHPFLFYITVDEAVVYAGRVMQI